MESIRCHFFNGDDLDSKRSIWVSWNKVLTSKEKGGLGAGNVGYTLTWCDIIKEIDRLASHGIDLISMMHKKIGNGLNTSFWKDWWRGEQRLKEVFPRIYALEVNKHISVAFKFEQTTLFSSLRRMPRSGIESEQWDHLLDSLEGVMLNPSEDRWSWDLNGSREFLVASARRYIDNNRLPDISSKTRWIKEVRIKVNVHAWKPCRLVQWLRVNSNNDNTTSTGSSYSNENDDGLLLNVILLFSTFYFEHYTKCLPQNVFDKGYDIENPIYASSEHVPHAIAAGLEGQHIRTRNTAGKSDGWNFIIRTFVI
nr:hypothetical protein [Tanacetum cinerariifolium]